MNWDALGAIAELVGAFGVIFSLLYLGLQIRGQNIESRLEASRNMTGQWNTFIGDIANNKGLAEVFRKGGVDMASLDDLEMVQFTAHISRTLRICESMYVQHAEGSLDNEIWVGIERAIQDLCSMPGVKSCWQTRCHWYSDRFRGFIQPMVDDQGEQRLYTSETV